MAVADDARRGPGRRFPLASTNPAPWPIPSGPFSRPPGPPLPSFAPAPRMAAVPTLLPRPKPGSGPALLPAALGKRSSPSLAPLAAQSSAVDLDSRLPDGSTPRSNARATEADFERRLAEAGGIPDANAASAYAASGAIGDWLGKVWPGGKWDFKSRTNAVGGDRPGNLNYGASGSVLFPEQVLTRAAGLVQMIQHGLDPARHPYHPQWGNPITGRGDHVGDDPRDTRDIRRGAPMGKIAVLALFMSSLCLAGCSDKIVPLQSEVSPAGDVTANYYEVLWGGAAGGITYCVDLRYAGRHENCPVQAIHVEGGRIYWARRTLNFVYCMGEVMRAKTQRRSPRKGQPFDVAVKQAC